MDYSVTEIIVQNGTMLKPVKVVFSISICNAAAMLFFCDAQPHAKLFANLELTWVWSKHLPTLFSTDLVKFLKTRFDTVENTNYNNSGDGFCEKDTIYTHGNHKHKCIKRFLRYTL